jgi:hypothetical protein
VKPDDYAIGEMFARKATPGPWAAERGACGALVIGPDGDSVLAAHFVGGTDGTADDNAAFVAHHSPDRLLALYAELRRAEAAFRWIASKVTFAHGKALGGDLHGADLVKRALSEVSEVSRGG